MDERSWVLSLTDCGGACKPSFLLLLQWKVMNRLAGQSCVRIDGVSWWPAVICLRYLFADIYLQNQRGYRVLIFSYSAFYLMFSIIGSLACHLLVSTLRLMHAPSMGFLPSEHIKRLITIKKRMKPPPPPTSSGSTGNPDLAHLLNTLVTTLLRDDGMMLSETLTRSI